MAMNSNDTSKLLPAVGFLETSSIAKGTEALDAMMKMAGVELLQIGWLPRGKHLILIGGTLDDVQQSMERGLQIAGNTVLDNFIIPNVHQQLLPATKGRAKLSDIEAVGIIETKEIASAVYAADAAVKAAAVTLIEVRLGTGIGGKGVVTLTGEVGAVRSAIAAGVGTIKKDGMLISQVIIPFAHKALLKALTQ